MTQTLFSWAPKSLQRVTAAIKVRHLLLGMKAMANLDSILKSRDMKKQSYGFSSSHVWMWKLDHKEGWAPKIWFELWCWRRLLRVLWTAGRSNQSILKEINPEYLEGLMLKMKFQYFGHLMWRADSLEKTLMLGKIEGNRKRKWQKMRWLSLIQWKRIWANTGRYWRIGEPDVLQAIGSQ